MSSILLIEAEHSLSWSADGVWSARVTPTQSQALLDELKRLRKIEKAIGERVERRHEEERARVEARFGNGDTLGDPRSVAHG